MKEDAVWAVENKLFIEYMTRPGSWDKHSTEGATLMPLKPLK